MGPKKKDREVDCIKIRSSEQTDHEIFLQAFEKPKQIYRYLRTRNMITPIFLYRNVSYMKDRSRRTNKSRSAVDCLLTKKTDEKNNGSTNDVTLGEYMTLMFLGFFDKTLPDDEVEVETKVFETCHTKGKDSFKILRFGRSVVKINPDVSCSNGKIPAVCVPTNNFKTPLHVSYKLQLNVKVLEKFTSNSEDSPETRPKRNKTVMRHRTYESELLVFDKQKRRLLSDGEYEISMQEKLPENEKLKKHGGNSFIDFQSFPKLKFHIAWTKEKCGDLVDRPSTLTLKKDECNKEKKSDRKHNGVVDVSECIKKTTVIYQLIHNNNSRQQMEPYENFCCIWCSLDCMALSSLLKHLKLCHARFNFKYISSNAAVRIDVSINELYDGSPHDIIGSSSFAFSRAGPVRRTSGTTILVCRPRRRLKLKLWEFFEYDEGQRQISKKIGSKIVETFQSGGSCSICELPDVDRLNFGEIHVLKELSVHLFCLYFSTNLSQRGSDNAGIVGFTLYDIRKLIKDARSQEEKCCFCNNIMATTYCHYPNCGRVFHQVCGHNFNARFEYLHNFRSFCDRHNAIENENIEYPEVVGCWICYEGLEEYHPVTTVPTCCGKWLHQQCLRMYALNSGYDFMCPICGDKNYGDFARRHGIFVPEYVALWEKTHDYADIERVYTNCDAINCICPDGRTFANRHKWKIQLCSCCGSFGLHDLCRPISERREEITCDICSRVFPASQVNERETVNENPMQHFATRGRCDPNETIATKKAREDAERPVREEERDYRISLWFRDYEINQQNLSNEST